MRPCSHLFPFVQGLPGSLPWGMIMTFLNDYFQQQYGLTPGVSGRKKKEWKGYGAGWERGHRSKLPHLLKGFHLVSYF